jgi:hypothetical protein
MGHTGACLRSQFRWCQPALARVRFCPMLPPTCVYICTDTRHITLFADSSFWPSPRVQDACCAYKRTVFSSYGFTHVSPNRGSMQNARWADVEDDAPQEDSTELTLVIQPLPRHVTRDRMHQSLEDRGYRGLFNYVHVPWHLRSNKNRGMAFVNFVSHEAGLKF